MAGRKKEGRKKEMRKSESGQKRFDSALQYVAATILGTRDRGTFEKEAGIERVLPQTSERRG